MKRQYTQEDMVRARRLWAEKREKIKADPSLCVGCGHPKDRTNRKTCTRCIKRIVARHKELIEERALMVHGDLVEKVDAALKMIQQLRSEVNALRSTVKLMRHSRAYIYQKAHRAGQKLGVQNGVKAAVKFQERLEANGREESIGEITRQELATMNHAYERR